LFTPLTTFNHTSILKTSRRTSFTVCVLMEDPKQINTDEEELVEPPINKSNSQIQVLLSNKLAKKNSERFTYLIATIMSSFGVTSMAIFDVYYKFSWQMEDGEVPWYEMFGTFALSVGVAVSQDPFSNSALESN
uniref:beta-carotene 3-hydroxylase n=1 Tax=Cicer arietinum TaxID=3827 RepID=A0A3Q7XVZ0_CICAR